MLDELALVLVESIDLAWLTGAPGAPLHAVPEAAGQLRLECSRIRTNLDAR